MIENKRTTSDSRSESTHMPEQRRTGERLMAILAAGLMLINFPILSIFSNNVLFLGVPTLYFYLFSAWALIIGATAFVLSKKPAIPGASPDKEKPKEP